MIKTLGVTCDVTDEAAVARMVETVSGEIGTADMLFNNAGINIMGGALELAYTDWKWIMDVNM